MHNPYMKIARRREFFVCRLIRPGGQLPGVLVLSNHDAMIPEHFEVALNES